MSMSVMVTILFLILNRKCELEPWEIAVLFVMCLITFTSDSVWERLKKDRIERLENEVRKLKEGEQQ